MQKRGQITVFIILGIIIVVAMGLLFAANIGGDFSQIIYDTKVKEYITSCLEQYTNDGLLLIGKQGGKLKLDGTGDYSLETGLLYETENYKVPYGIKKSDEELYPLGYPYRGALVENPDKPNYFGNYVTGFDDHLSFLNPLCNWKSDSPNYFNIEGAKKTCETYGRENTVQDNLQRYIKENMVNCEIGTAFPEYDIETEEVNISVIIGEDDLIIKAEYPVEVSINGKTKTKLLDYSINPKIRLKKVHELASHLIGWKDSEGLGINPKGDVTNLFFDIITDAGDLELGCRKANKIEKVSCLYPGMEVSKIYNVCPTCPDHEFDDILNITDKNSIINGKPFTFLFAIENRRPALDLIDDVSAGDTITAEGFDPDDGDVLTYKWYVNGNSDPVRTGEYNEFTESWISLAVEVCDNANLCDSQDIEIQ